MFAFVSPVLNVLSALGPSRSSSVSTLQSASSSGFAVADVTPIVVSGGIPTSTVSVSDARRESPPWLMSEFHDPPTVSTLAEETGKIGFRYVRDLIIHQSFRCLDDGRFPTSSINQWSIVEEC